MPSRPAASRPNHLLAALPPDEFAAVEPHLEPVDLRRGTVLFEAGERIGHVWFPQSCVVSLTVIGSDGAAAETAVIGREGMTGFALALGGDRAMNRDFVQIAGAAWRLPAARFEAALERGPALRPLVLRHVGALMGQALQSVACNALHPAEARLARWLLMLHDRVEDDVLPLTQEFLAEMLGLQRTTVTAAAGALQRAGAIDYGRGVIFVADRGGLEAAACECYGEVRKLAARLLPGALG